jgi:hypothetical protein
MAKPTASQVTNFFISYTAADRAWAEWVAWQLHNAGYTVMLQAWDFVPGRDFLHEMERATSCARRTIAILSDSYSASVYGEAEWRAAFARDPTGEKGLLIPVKVASCTPPSLLVSRVHIDLTDKPADEARDVLLAGVSGEGMRPAGEPAFPGQLMEPPMFPGDTGKRHRSIERRDGRIQFPRGLTAIYFQHGPGEGAAFASDQYSTFQELLDELYVNYLREQYPPFSYGEAWVLRDGQRYITPLAWLSVPCSPVDAIAKGWKSISPSAAGIYVNRGYMVRDPRGDDHFGAIADDEVVMDVLSQSPKIAYEIDRFPVLSTVAAQGLGRYEGVFSAWWRDFAGKIFDLRAPEAVERLRRYWSFRPRGK